MDHVETFHRHVDECRMMARSTKDPESRSTWNSLAERWQRCAEVAERAMADATAVNYERTRKLKRWSGSDAR